MKRLCLVGDSDIALWPKELFPSVSSMGDDTDIDIDKDGVEVEWEQQHLVSGHSGVTLAEVLPHLRTVLARSSEEKDNERMRPITSSSSSDTSTRTTTTFIVACAGENDIGQGLSLTQSIKAMRELLDIVFLHDDDDQYHHHNRCLLFLGPKFEPWLEHCNDPIYKKKYIRMTLELQRLCQEYEVEKLTLNVNNGDTTNRNTNRITFIDCLTMFCDETTATIPGARLGGRARADPQFFSSDQLHLGKEGYKVWKDVVENKIQHSILTSSISS